MYDLTIKNVRIVDGQAVPLDYPKKPHPRIYGTFPRVIAHYCKEGKLFFLETAIEKMTGLPAARLIKEGMWADLVLFDFQRLQDTPTFQEPRQACQGGLMVFVNGVLTAENGSHTGAWAGTVLRKNING